MVYRGEWHKKWLRERTLRSKAERERAELHGRLLFLRGEIQQAVREAQEWCDDPDDFDGVPHVCDLIDVCEKVLKLTDRELSDAKP